MIPVVYNGANMSRIAPPHSYIDVKDFQTVRGDNNIITVETELIDVSAQNLGHTCSRSTPTLSGTRPTSGGGTSTRWSMLAGTSSNHSQR